MDRVYFNFTDFGYKGWLPITQLEMQMLWDGSEDIMREHEIASIMMMMDITRCRLKKQARSGAINPEWVTTAVMLWALGGRLGQPLPDYWHEDQ